ncbi:hypothetical protein ACWD0A_34595 [Streptomyces sp. NPDC002867]
MPATGCAGRSTLRGDPPKDRQRLTGGSRGSGFNRPMPRFLFTGCLVVLATGLAAAISIGFLHR